MPDLCRGSGAAPNPIYGSIVTMTGAAIEAFLVTRMPRPAAQFFSVVLAGTVYDLDQVCAGQPPAAPTLTDADVLALANFYDIVPFTAAALKLKDWFLALYWPVVCNCNDGLPPGTQTAPALPPVEVSPGLPQSEPSVPCWHVHQRVIHPADTAPGPQQNLSQQFLPGAPVPGLTGTEPLTTGAAIPTGATAVSYNTTAAFSGTPVATATMTLQFYDVNKARTANSFQLARNAGSNVQNQLAIPAGSAYWLLSISSGTGNPVYDVDTDFSITCSSAPSGGLTTPCCPPDPQLELKLNQILGLVTLLQRQTAPFAYVPGVTHPGLTGSGEIAVQGLLGVKILPSSIPPGVGVDVGDPDTLWLDSWINWGNADGWTTREWLRSSPFISLPALAGQYTKVGYTLRPGLTVDLVELKREP